MVSILEGLGVVIAVHTVVCASIVTWLASLHKHVLREVSISKHKLREEKWYKDSPGEYHWVILERNIHVGEVNRHVEQGLRHHLVVAKFESELRQVIPDSCPEPKPVDAEVEHAVSLIGFCRCLVVRNIVVVTVMHQDVVNVVQSAWNSKSWTEH